MKGILFKGVAFLVSTFAAVTIAGCGGANLDGEFDSSGVGTGDAASTGGSYVIVDTDQSECYDEALSMACPGAIETFYGQDAQYDGNQPSYTDNGDGTITDNVTGLMWQRDPGDKVYYDEAVAGAADADTGGYDDWRLPTIKELYSLIQFSGEDPSIESDDSTSDLTPFIDTYYFDFEYGDTGAGDRIIDSQWATSSIYESTVMDGRECFFGVNFADGRIKCYPTDNFKTYYVIYVRSDTAYGQNSFADNGDGTITDEATGLMWMQDDSGSFGVGDGGDGALDWEQALAWCEDQGEADHIDWRLPNAKELQSIVDYSRSPDTTDSAAIDPLFDITSITNEAGELDYPFYWTGTTHASSNGMGSSGAYVSFGRAMGYMNGYWMDVHGAGAQRSDPKDGDPDDYSFGMGPQGDARRIYNYARCVRNAGE